MALVVPLATRAKAHRIRRERERVRVANPNPYAKYQTDPLGFFVDVLKIPAHTIRWSLNSGYTTPLYAENCIEVSEDTAKYPAVVHKPHEWDGTPDPFMAMLAGLVSWRNVGVESATTTGKTYCGAATVLWFLGCFVDSLVVTVAPKEEQLEKHIWKEISKLWPAFSAAFPSAKMDSLRIRMRGDETWAASGFVAGVKAAEAGASATKAQGFHAEHMLIVFEEMPGINPAIPVAFENTCRAPHNLRLAFGNPDHQLDPLHLFCQGPRTDHIIISAYDHPNIVTKNPNLIPGAVSQQGIDDALEKARNNGGAENRMFKSRVRGISPAEAADALIKLEWVQAAQAKWLDTATRAIMELQGSKALGVDVADSEDGDEGAIARGMGSVLQAVESFPCPNANNLGTRVAAEMTREGIMDDHVGVDDVGVGAGCQNELEHLNKYVRALHGKPIGWIDEESGKPQTEDFISLRAQMYWQMAEDLRRGRIALPPDLDLATELTTPTWFTRKSKIHVEPKEEIKARSPNGKSPNKADAAVYWNFVRQRKAVASTLPVINKASMSLRERAMQDLRDLETPAAPKKYYGTVLRQ